MHIDVVILQLTLDTVNMAYLFPLQKVDGFPNILNLIDPQSSPACMANPLTRYHLGYIDFRIVYKLYTELYIE